MVNVRNNLIIVGNNQELFWGLNTEERFKRLHKNIALQSNRKIVVKADYIFDLRLYQSLAEAQNTFLIDDSGVICAANIDQQDQGIAIKIIEGQSDETLPSGYKFSKIEEIAGFFDRKLRKSDLPYLLSIKENNRENVEKIMFAGVYKGVTDIVTKYLWPIPAFFATRQLAKLRIHPNLVTIAGFLFMILATFMFWHGYFISGLIFAWAMTFLDTVDGKLARLTLTSSQIGDILDHGMDLIHPPFWWYAFWWGLTEIHGNNILLFISMIIILSGYVIGRLIELWSKIRFGFNMFIWRPFDTWFRLILARRNPNMIILTIFVLINLANIGYISVAIWTVISTIIHFYRVRYAYQLKLSGHEIYPWLAKAENQENPEPFLKENST